MEGEIRKGKKEERGKKRRGRRTVEVKGVEGNLNNENKREEEGER